MTLGGFESISESDTRLRAQDRQAEIEAAITASRIRIRERITTQERTSRNLFRALSELTEAREQAGILSALRAPERAARARRFQRAVHEPIPIPRTPSGRPAQPAFRGDLIVPERLPTPPPAQADRFRTQNLPVLGPSQRVPTAVPQPVPPIRRFQRPRSSERVLPGQVIV